ncbi:MAG: hypothetical protein ACLFU8_06255 [Anaerolineales bacterium]
MQRLPITHVTLYKHGVGFFERRGEVDGEKVTLSFRLEEMNDLLKSLTVIDEGGGQVLGIDYATPQSREERLAGSSIRLDDARSLQDLLVGLRGRRVRLLLDQGEALEGTLVGMDEAPEGEPLATALVSVLTDGAEQVNVVPFGRVQGVEILDEQGAQDLRFFLETSLTQEDYRRVNVRLSAGAHFLSVRYLAPAPTWRVSYRLVAEPEAGGERGEALLQGWGIFDNRLEEDLGEISLALVAGMPISFVYDLYTPFTPERPVVEEEARVAAAPVEFEESLGLMSGAEAEAAPPPAFAMRSARAAPAPQAKMERARLRESTAVQAQGKALGELFQYVIETPVTVGRGQSAMVPILGAAVDYTKSLLYNGAKLPTHPVATLRLKNSTGLTLERGPVTVIEGGEYVGEALLPFTVVGGDLNVPYAVELGVRVREEQGSERRLHGIDVAGLYLQFEEWDVRWRTYQISNRTARTLQVFVEHPRSAAYELFNSAEPRERTDDYVRFAVTVQPRDETTLKVQERRLIRRKEELRRQSLKDLHRYLRRGLIDQAVLDRLAKLLMLWDSIADYEKKIAELQAEREKLYQAQRQIQGNMAALSQTGKEGALRARYVEQLEGTEEQLRALERRERELRAEIERVEEEIEARVKALDE